MNTDKIKELGKAWTALDDQYDNYVQGLIDAPELTPLTSEKLEMLKEKQKELFDLEVRLFDVLQGK
jgi:hypothetical protein